MGRVISTAIQFIDGFTRPSREVIQSMRRMGNEAVKAGKQIQNAGRTITAAGSALTKSITLPIAGAAAAAIKTAADFESSMSQVAATMGKSVDEIGELTSLAQHMGATTAFSASEAAEGINILAMAGLNITQIGDSLGTVLDLAAAGAMDMGSSASYVVGAVKGFRDEMSNASKYADLMAKGATLANTDVSALGEAISFGAATANGYRQSADSMTLSLLRLAEQNVVGQTAATSLNRAMADLYTPTAGAKKALDSLKISAYNADGTAKDFNEVVDSLAGALKGMSEEEANAVKNTIFTTNGLNAFNKMTASSKSRVDELKEGLQDSLGSASQQAKTQLDNLSGQLTILKSAVEGAAIAFGNKMLPYIKNAVSYAQNLMDKINGLSDAQMSNILKWAGIAAAAGSALMVFGKVVSIIGTVQRTIGSVTKAIANFGGIMGMITSPAGIVIGALAAIAVGAVLIIKNWDKVKSFLQNVKGWFADAFEQAGLSVEDFKSKFTAIGSAVGGIIGKFIGFGKTIASLFGKEFSGSIREGAGEIIGLLQTLTGGAEKAFHGVVSVLGKELQVFDAALGFLGTAFSGNWEGAVRDLKNSLKDIFPPDMAAGLIKAFDFIAPALKAGVSGVRAVFTGLVNDVKKIFSGVSTVVKGINTMFKGIFSGDAQTALKGFQTAASGIIQTVANIFKAKINAMKNFVVGAFSTFLPESAVTKIAGVFDRMIGTINACVRGLLTVLDGVTTFISGVFTGNWQQAWTGVQTIFKGVFESFAALCKAPINAVIGIINSAIAGLNKINVTIPEWVPGLGGKSFGMNIPSIPMLYKGTDNWKGGAAIIHDRGGEIVDLPKGSRVYPHDKSVEMARQAGASQGQSVTVSIQKLADKIEIRSEEDIDRIAEALAYRLKRVAFNTGMA